MMILGWYDSSWAGGKGKEAAHLVDAILVQTLGSQGLPQNNNRVNYSVLKS